MKTFFFWKTPKARFFKVVVEHQIKKAPSLLRMRLSPPPTSLWLLLSWLSRPMEAGSTGEKQRKVATHLLSTMDVEAKE